MSFKNYTLIDRKNILERYKNAKNTDHVYKIMPDCYKFMSPIERNVWSDIRTCWIKMYPQYPVLWFFLDFWDPENKIGIEVDGKEFHLDKEKDAERQNKIEKLWWTIYRIKWYATFKNIFKDENDLFNEEMLVLSEYQLENQDSNIKEYRELLEDLRLIY